MSSRTGRVLKVGSVKVPTPENTTINSTGLVTVNFLENGGVASGIGLPGLMLRRILFLGYHRWIGLSGCSADCRDEFVDKRFGIFDDRPFVHDDGYRSYSVKHCWQ